jgi:hypothetical protein
MHEADLFRVLPGHDAADVKRWYANDDLQGTPPAVAFGGILDNHDTSRTVWIHERRRTQAA